MAFPTPVAAFSFDEGSGIHAVSEMGGYTLNAVSANTAWGTGVNASGAAGRFTGALATSLTTWSVQFDVYITSLNGWSSIIEGNDLYFEFNGSGVFDVALGGSDGTVTGATLGTGSWHTITITHDSAQERTIIYTDNNLTTTKNHASSTGSVNFAQTLEICGSTAQPMSGKMDNVRVWNVVLTQAQAQEAATNPARLPGSARVWNGTSWTSVQPCVWNGSAWAAVNATVLGSGGGGSPGGGGNQTLTYPRLAGMLIGNPHNYHQSSYQQQIAKLDLAILGVYNGWNLSGVTPAQAVNSIKGYNPNILLGNYTLMTEVPTSSSDTATQDLRNKLSSSVGPNGIGDWWGYNSAGAHTDWSGGTYPVNDTNLTLQVTPDSNGDRWPQWLAKRDNSLLISNANWDIWYCDNNFWQPRSNADWDRNGTNDDKNNIAIQNIWRNGQRAYYDTALSLQPGKMVMVNADNDLDGSTFPSEAEPFTQYKNVLGGAFLEHAIGKTWSAEYWGGWSMMMDWYHKASGNLTNPTACILDAYMGDNTTDYKTLRYAFASSLMDDGYFSASDDYNRVLWYDEFNLAGTATTKWLGTAIDGIQTTAWASGVYRRRFANGMVLVNPKGNGQRTVTIGTGYRRFSGTQDPTTNNGQVVTSTVTLADRDALFLVKQ